MAPARDTDHPSMRGHSIYGMPDDEWLALRQHALAEGVTASGIAVVLLRQYLRWPSALKAPVLRDVRGEERDA